MDYAAQLREKQKRVADLFGASVVDPILGALEQYRYRNKMEFTFSENRAQERFLGLMIAQAEPYVFHLQECWIGPFWFQQVVKAVKSWWEQGGYSAYSPRRNEGCLRYLTLRHSEATQEKMVILNVAGQGVAELTEQARQRFMEVVQEEIGDPNAGGFLRIHWTNKGTPTHFEEIHLGGLMTMREELLVHGHLLSFSISPSSFFQPNPRMATILYEKALSWFQGTSLLFDLYSGTGTLSVAASLFADQVVGIELNKDSVADAKENARYNRRENVTFYAGDVGHVLSVWLQEHLVRPDGIIVDPPRKGLDAKALDMIACMQPRKIAYISCNPVTQKQDVDRLIERAGYELCRVIPIDQFPHTYHIETIALLNKN
jgi:23S rRNA (uracil1939-C5)-methyltransferase